MIDRIEQFAYAISDNPHLQAITAIAAAIILASLVDLALNWVIRPVLARTRYEVDDKILRLARAPVFFTIILSGFGIALRLDPLPKPFDVIAAAAMKTLLVLVWLIFSGRVATLLLTWSAMHPTRIQVVQPASLPAFQVGTKLLLFALGVYLVLEAWDVDATAWLTSAGIAGIVLGLAARETLANLFAGIFILADAPYKVGDFIVLDNDRGQVTKIGLRSTRLLTRDDTEITIPNSIIANSKIINESGGPSSKHRVRIPITVAYGTDLDRIRTVLEEVAASDPYVADEPTPRVRYRGFGESGIALELLCWISVPMNRGLALDSLVTRTYGAFRREGVEIPSPKRELYIKDALRLRVKSATRRRKGEGEKS